MSPLFMFVILIYSLQTINIESNQSVSGDLTERTYWELVREDLQEYILQNSALLRNYLACLDLGNSLDSDAVRFNESVSICNLYSCMWGKWGCRKCRNRFNNNGHLMWVRPLLNGNNRMFCWRTFQHRVDESLLFNRSWNEYQVGFGQGESRNFWLGLDALHMATKDGDRRVRWELTTWPGVPYWSENEHIIVAGPTDNYRLSLGPLDSNRSTLEMDDLNNQRSANNRSFSTYDRDNDLSPKCCADLYYSGWWFGKCFWMNPNGRYFNFEATGPGDTNGPAMVYMWPGSTYPFISWYSLRSFECLIVEFLSP